MERLQRQGRGLRPYLGIKLAELQPKVAQQWTEAYREQRPDAAALPHQGLHVMHVEPGSPAQRGGVRVGDTIVEGGTGRDTVELTSSKQFIDLLTAAIKRRVALKLVRDGRAVSVDVVVESVQQ